MISAHSATHSLQIATAGVGPATIDSTSARGLPQNEQRIESADRLGPGASSGMGRPRAPSGQGRTAPRMPRAGAAHQRPTQRWSAFGAVTRYIFQAPTWAIG